jgi:general secretion pathway protein B
MSYVLEALKKAQAQREQGTVPGIHSVQVPYVAVPGKARSNLKPVLWAIALLLGLVVLLLAWRMAQPTPARLEPVPAVAQAASVQVAPVQVAPVAASVPAPVLTPSWALAPEPLPEAEVPVPASSKEERAAAKKKERAQRKEAEKELADKALEKSAKAAETARVYLLPELPDAIRRELPALVISGGSYSSNPAQRLIIVNNQVFTEGSQPVPGVVVQRIEPAAAVLGFKGYSYRVGY